MAKRVSVLKVSGLRRAFGPNTIFDGFNLEVRAGEAIALTGRNGAGKSTLLRCLVGADRPDDGTIQVCGNPMSETLPTSAATWPRSSTTSTSSPTSASSSTWTCWPGRTASSTRTPRWTRSWRRCSWSRSRASCPGTLSSGQRRRLALATAFVRPRKLLILDEPEQRLDTEGVAWLANRLKSERQQGLAIVFASHEPSPGRDRGDPHRRARSAPRMSAPETDTDVDPPATPHLVPPPPRELKLLIRDWRRGRATKRLGEALQDAYVAVIAALMLGAMVLNVILRAQRTVAGCASATCLSSRALLPLAAFTAAVAVALAVSRLFGPVLASAAEGFWLLDAPISRFAMLRSRLVGIVARRDGGGAVIGGLVSALTGAEVHGVVAWAVATGLSAAAAVAFAAAQQGIEQHRLTRVVSYVFGLSAVVALLAVVGSAAGWVRLGISADRSLELGLIMIGFSGLVLLVALVIAARRLRHIRRTRLLSGGALVSGISGRLLRPRPRAGPRHRGRAARHGGRARHARTRSAASAWRR